MLQFIHMITRGRVEELLGADQDDWQERVLRMRLMKHAWDASDLEQRGFLLGAVNIACLRIAESQTVWNQDDRTVACTSYRIASCGFR